jgi:hypothetical protein
MAFSVGLGGQDLALDRTAAIRWVPRRAAHVLLAGAVVAAVLLTVQTMGTSMATTAFVVRDSAGLTGLAALGATLSGGQYAWTLPFAWLSFSFFAPPPTSAPMRVAMWMLLPPGTAAGTWTALVLTGRRHRGLRHRGTEAVAGIRYLGSGTTVGPRYRGPCVRCVTTPCCNSRVREDRASTSKHRSNVCAGQIG